MRGREGVARGTTRRMFFKLIAGAGVVPPFRLGRRVLQLNPAEVARMAVWLG